MTKVYVLSKIGYEYNDEYNYRPEDEGVNPQEVYKNKEEADKTCHDLNLKEFRTIDIAHYCGEDGSKSLSYNRNFDKQLSQILGVEINNESLYDCHTDLTKRPKEVVEQVMTLCNRLRFYEIRELELHG